MANYNLTLASTGTSQDAVLADLSTNGRFLSYIVIPDATDGSQNATLFVRDLQTGQVQQVASFAYRDSQSSSVGHTGVFGGDLSADGRFIVYTTGAVADFETIGVPSTVFIKDLQTGVETPLTTNNGFEDYRVVDVSANGRFVLFEKKEAFALTNTEADDEFIVVDTLTGNTRSVLAQASFALGTHALDISEDGRYVIYQEFQSGNSEHGIYEYDLQTGSRTKITAEGQLFSGNAFQSPSSVDDILSANGRYLAYDVVSSGQTQVFVQDLNNPILQPRLVSAAADGTPGNDGSVVFGISGDGRFVAFGSDADNLVPNDTNSKADLFVKDLLTGEVTRFEGASAGFLGFDGDRVVFQTAQGLLPGDTDGAVDVYVADLAPPPTLDIVTVAGDNLINRNESFATFVTGTSNEIGATVTISIDGKVEGTATVTSGGTWNVNLDVRDLVVGPHTVDASVTDIFGETASDSQAVILDTIPPMIDIVTIADDFVVNVSEARAPVLATGTSDAIGGTVTLGYLLGGVQTVVQADGSWSVPVPIAGLEGKIPFIGRVPDAAGNFGVDAELVFVDKSHAPADLSAAGLDGTKGFKINGITGDGGQQIGLAVSSAGDINGDGFDDVIIGNERATPNGATYAGQSYVVFGKAGGFPAALDLANLDGANGFRIDGLDKNDSLGRSVAAAGDVNGDGIGDLVIGAPSGSSGGIQFAGETYVVFGKTEPWSDSFDLATLDGKNGFRIDGASGASGGSVASAGDVNGDGFDDVIIGAANASPGGKLYAGESYVVFGAADGFAPTMALTSLDGSNGFKIPGTSVFGFVGTTVASAGDVNGDGFGDLLVTATLGGKGEAYLLFGQADWKDTPSFDLSALDGANGVRISTSPATPAGGGIEIANSIGDINGDGFDDLVLGFNDLVLGNEEVHVVFGKGTGWDANLFLSELDGTNSFQIVAEPGHGVGNGASAGDVNGDGIDDFIIAGGFGGEGAAGGEVHVIYGKAGDWAPILSTASLNGGNGFTVAAANLNDGFGSALASGDVNKDGFADLVIGAFSGKGGSTNFQPSGEAYVVFGADLASQDKTVTLNPVTGDDRLEAGDLTAPVAVTGTSDAIGDTVDIFVVRSGFDKIDGVPVASAVVAADGTWSTAIDPSVLVPGHLHIRATVTEDGGYTASDGAIVLVPGMATGKVVDGYISGASVFADGNGNGKLDAGEFATVSDAGGNFALAGGEGATLVATGGTDIATGLTPPGTLFAPAGSGVITPLTTLEHYLIENEGQSKEEALQRAREAIQQEADAQGKGGFSDPINGFLGGNVGAGAEIIGNAQIAGACAIAGAALAALDGSGGVSADMAYDAYAATLAHILATNPDATLRQHDIRDALDETLQKLQIQAEEERDAALGATATLIGALFGDTGAIITQTDGLVGTDYLSTVAAISLVAQGGAASDLSEAVGLAISGPPNFPFAALALAADAPADPLAAVVAAYTGDALLEKIAAAQQQLGDVDGPAFENAPVAVADSFATDEDRPLVVDGKDGVLANDSDADGDTLTATLVSGPAHGVIILAADGSFAYTPDADFNGSDSFTYKAGDGGLESATQTVTITVDPVNDAPDAQNDSYTTDEDRPLVVDAKDGVLANDSDGDPLSAVLVDGPDHGKVALFADGTFLYTPDANYNGADSFSYMANDGTIDSNVATVSLTVNAVNDDPMAPAANSVTTDEDKASAPVAIGAADLDGDSLVYSVKAGSSPALGTVGFQGGSFVYTPNTNANGADSFVIVVDDGHGGKIEQAVAVTINAVADAAVIGGVTAGNVTEDGVLTANGKLSVTDPDAGEASFQAGSFKAAHGTLTLDAAGAWVYTLDNTDASVQALSGSQTLPDSVTVHSVDGTAQQILVTIHGADESTGAIVGNDRANNLSGTAGNDVIEGRGGSDIVHAGAGNDTIVGTVGDGLDLYFGGAGNDTLDLSAITAGVVVDLDGAAIGAQIGLDLLSSIENVIGGKGNDRLTGDEHANLLNGGGGNDTLFGDAGNDTLIGGPGKDSYSGGRGDDVIALSLTTFAAIDGGSGTDTIRLDGAGLTLDLTAINQTAIKGIEHIDLTGSGVNALKLVIQDVLDLSDISNQLLVLGDAGDTVHKGAGWTAGAVVTIAGQDYQSYTAGSATLLIDTDIATVA